MPDIRGLRLIGLFLAAGLALPGSVAASTVSGAPLELIRHLLTWPERSSGYDRAQFPHWIDADGDGCDTRREVLIDEALLPPRVGGRCRLTGGLWYSAYDGLFIADASGLDIDHVVALGEAWRSGAHAWTTDRRRDFANDLADPRSLRAVSARSNRAKGDRDPARWLPPKVGFRCRYVTEWLGVKVRWRLAIDPAERAAMLEILRSCPATPVRVDVP